MTTTTTTRWCILQSLFISLVTTKNTESRNRHLETFLTDYSSTISQDDKPETKKQHQKKDPKKSTGHEQASELYLILGP